MQSRRPQTSMLCVCWANFRMENELQLTAPYLNKSSCACCWQLRGDLTPDVQGQVRMWPRLTSDAPRSAGGLMITSRGTSCAHLLVARNVDRRGGVAGEVELLCQARHQRLTQLPKAEDRIHLPHYL